MREETAKKLLDKVRDDYDAIADSFSDTRVWVWPEMEAFKEYVNGGDHVLDIGCGNGRAYQLLDGMAIEYEGIDVSEKLIGYAKSQVSDILASFRVGSVLDLPYENTTFDAVMAVAVIHHIPSERFRVRALGEIFRVLKPGGHLLMTNWNTWNMGNLVRHPMTVIRMFFPTKGLDFKDILVPWKKGERKVNRYYHVFTKREMRRLCEKVGFEVSTQYYTTEGAQTSLLKGHNLVTICKRPAETPKPGPEESPFL